MYKRQILDLVQKSINIIKIINRANCRIDPKGFSYIYVYGWNFPGLLEEIKVIFCNDDE